MAQEERTPQPVAGTAPTPATDRPPDRLVRHVFWKYPLLAFVLLVIVAVLAGFVGSPNWPRDTIATVTQKDPGGAIMAFTQELDGTATSTGNAQEFGMSDPGQVFVLGPLHLAAPLLASDVVAALGTYDAASPDQRQVWASAYDKALGSITAQGGGTMGGGTPSPDYKRIGTLKGDFGPVPVLVQADLQLAQNGHDFSNWGKAIAELHSLNVIHGDLQPSNLLGGDSPAVTDLLRSRELNRPLTILERAQDLALLKLHWRHFLSWEAIKLGYRSIAPKEAEEVFKLL